LLKVELMSLESQRAVMHATRSWHTLCVTSTEGDFMELMEVYHEAMAKWIIARATTGKCEGSEFVFDLIESAIRKEATEILLTPVQESDMVRMDFGRLHCYYRQPKITRAQFAYLAIYLVLIGNVAAQGACTERLFRGSDERLYNLQFGKILLPDSEPAVVIYIEPHRPTTTAR
jgi:hypothetical protein